MQGRKSSEGMLEREGGKKLDGYVWKEEGDTTIEMDRYRNIRRFKERGGEF